VSTLVPMKPKTAKQSRTDIKNMLRIRLTEAERKMLDAYAESKGAGTSTWARMELLGIASRGKR
jgi:hypothetical protein